MVASQYQEGSGLDLTSALQLCVVDTEVILPVSPTDNLGWQHLKMLADAGFLELLSPWGLSNAYRDLPAQDHVTLVRWPISWTDEHLQDSFSVSPVMCAPAPDHSWVFPKARTTIQILPPPSSTPFLPFGSWCYVSPRKPKHSVSECCLYFPWQQEQIPVCPHIGHFLYTKEVIPPNSSLVNKCLHGAYAQEHGCGVINRRSNITQKD